MKPHIILSRNLSSAYTKNTYVSISIYSQQTHFISLIHSSKTLSQLTQIHCKLISLNLSQNTFIITQLLSSFFLKQSPNYAFSLFNQIKNPNLPVFNATIRGFCQNLKFYESIKCFLKMLKLGIFPNRLTLPYLCKCVSALSFFQLGRCFHSIIVKIGVNFDSFVLVSLVDFYVKIGSLSCATKVFDESLEKNKLESILLWNVLINGYCKAGELEKALKLFETMPNRNIGSWNSMIDGFMKKGDVKRANKFFSRMVEKNVVTWTTMVTGLSQNGSHEEALLKFFEMVENGVKANDLSTVSALSACAKVRDLEAGIRIEKCCFGGFSRIVGTAFVDMYAKCGDIESAKLVFGKMKEKDVYAWSVMISGLAMHGCFEQAVECFMKMVSAGITPDGVVFLAILTACLHSGKVDEGLRYFESMRVNYSINPTMKHYALIVDLLGRAGRLDEALSFIESMPLEPDFVIWGALFCSCRAHKNIEMAELASKRLLQLEPKHPGGYVFLSNVYAGGGRWDDVERVRSSMKDRGVEKDAGWSYG